MPTGIATNYDLPIGLMLDIEDAIHLLSPFDTPLTGGVGADGRTVFPGGNIFEVKHSWLHEELLTPRTSVAATQVTAATTLVVPAGHRLRISTGDILMVDNEYQRVTGYNGSAETLDVTKAYGGSTTAQHVTNAVVMILGTALPEGSNPENPRYQDRTEAYNLTQIFGPTAIRTSGTEDVVRKYGLGGQSEFQHQVANRIKEHWIAFEQALMYGVRSDDTTNKIRSMGGLAFYVTAANGSVMDTTTTTFSESSLVTNLQACFDNGGQPDRAIMGSKNKRLASSFESAGELFIQRGDTGRGTIVNYLDSDFGRLSFILDRWCRLQDVFLLEREQVQIATLRPLIFEMLAKTGDSTHGQILCEKSAKVRRFSHACRYTALT